MSASGMHAHHPRYITRILAIGALASWPLPFWCYGLHIGATAAADTAVPLLIGLGVISLAMRLLLHRHPEDFALFLPVRLDQRGTVMSIRLNATLLMAFNLGASWFLLHTSFSRTTMILLLVLTTVSTMNLSDECWIARRSRLGTQS